MHMQNTNEKIELLKKNIIFLKDVLEGLKQKGSSYITPIIASALEKLGIDAYSKNVGPVPIEEQKSSLRAA
jgi:hypothetical protein